jgi:hypothetical protein
MDTQKIHIGILSPATADRRPHFKSLERMLPPEVTVKNEGLGLLQNSYHQMKKLDRFEREILGAYEKGGWYRLVRRKPNLLHSEKPRLPPL